MARALTAARRLHWDTIGYLAFGAAGILLVCLALALDIPLPFPVLLGLMWGCPFVLVLGIGLAWSERTAVAPVVADRWAHLRGEGRNGKQSLNYGFCTE